ncbi:amino acid/polyamine transporter I [Achaetomium macrosporum]|uniref:Amino acid/polyamine transporter I n=1 Tax=Achaetomium macrosporum TaxID=79813 RepID=A0AAN7C4P2_9PEZI|nr:amino acid/polyamine transporter I [Achaetomium macrosporum]
MSRQPRISRRDLRPFQYWETQAQRLDKHRHTVEEDAAALERLGHKQELKRNFSMVSMLGLAFAILNSWTALAASISLALPSGGASSVIWGLIVAGICNLCLAASLAEFLSAYPTAGGQYHWAAIVSWKRWSRGISYCTGWINMAGWVALSATGPLLGSTFVVNVIALFNPSYEAEAWHQFLIYIGFTLFALVVNAFLTRLMPYFTKAAFIWSLLGFVVISITVLACASPNYQSGRFVYGNFLNETGWPDGVAWLLGLLQGAFGLAGFDATVHMIEEIPRPQLQGPRIMLYCIGIGMFTGFVFLSCLLFVVADIEAAIDASAGPLLQIFMDATKSRAGSTCLLMFPLVCMLFTTTTLMTTSSRMSYAFARDRGMPFSSVFAKVHPSLDVPLNALLWTAVWVVVFGCILLGSTSTFNAITSASVVALGVTYAIPPTINVLRGRTLLPATRVFKLPGWLGWICNLVGIAWTILTTVLFVFPPVLPVTPDNMNYCIVAFGVILLISCTTWLVDGRKHYTGPKVDVYAMLEGKVTGMDPSQYEPQSAEKVGEPAAHSEVVLK